MLRLQMGPMLLLLRRVSADVKEPVISPFNMEKPAWCKGVMTIRSEGLAQHAPGSGRPPAGAPAHSGTPPEGH